MNDLAEFPIDCRRKGERRSGGQNKDGGTRRDALSPNSQANQNANLLTRRELDVLLCMVEGKTDRQIAESLDLSQKTVGHHVRALLIKLEAKNRTQAVVKALSMELVNFQPNIGNSPDARK